MNVVLFDKSDYIDNQLLLRQTRQINHIIKVLKLQVGDQLKIAEKNGKIGTGIIAQIQSDQIRLQEICLTKSPPKKLPLTVILALPRPKVLRRLLMDMTAIGVQRIVLINSYRTDKSYWSSPLLARSDEFIEEGLEQGVDSVPPKLILAKRFKPFVEDELPKMMAQGRAVVAHPYAQLNFSQYTINHQLPDIVIIGAEGGFIPYEIELLNSVSVTPVSLGSRILRTEAAVNALLGRWLL